MKSFYSNMPYFPCQALQTPFLKIIFDCFGHARFGVWLFSSPEKSPFFLSEGAFPVFSAEKGLTAHGQSVTIWLQVCIFTPIINRRNYISASETPVLTYKGHPLRRKDNLIYFGTMAEKYIVMMQILSTKKVGDLDVADKVSVQLQLTAPDLKSRDRVVKKSEKDSLYAAMDVACVWLERALSGK